jgi:hypothetical protein
MLKNIFKNSREIIRGWRKLYNEEPHDLYSSLHVISVNNDGLGMWHIREKRKMKNERDHLEDPHIDERRALKWILRK